MHALHIEVCGIDDLVRCRVYEDGLGVDASLVGEGTGALDRIIEGNVDFNRRSCLCPKRRANCSPSGCVDSMILELRTFDKSSLTDRQADRAW